MGEPAALHAFQPTLLIRPQPFRTEGPKGYLLRLAEANWIRLNELKELGLQYDYELLKFQGLLPSEPMDPELHGLVRSISAHLQGNPRVWNHAHGRFCPLCLAEDAHWRAGWELLFHDACPEHGVWLIDRCGSCGDKLSWGRDHLLRCQCGSDLRTEKANASPDNVRQLSALLEDKLLTREASYQAPFQKTSLEQTQQLIRYMGTYMNPVSGRNPLKIREAGAIASSWQVTSLAAEILYDWPNAFQKSLERIQSEATGTEARQLGGVFGRAYHYLYRGLVGSAFNPVRDSFESWLSSSWRGGVAKRNRRLALLLLDKATWIPANLATDTLGISHQRLMYLIRQKVIEGETYISKSGRKFVMVRRDQLDLARENIEGRMDMQTAGAALGLNKARMRQMLKLLFPGAVKTGGSATPWSIPRSEIEALLMVSSKLERVAIPDEGAISLGQVFRFWAWTAEEIAQLIDEVRFGDMKPTSYLDSGMGINGWIFEEHVLKAWRARSIQGFGTWVTIPQMAKILGIKQQAAYDLVRLHFINGEALHRQPRMGVRVNRIEIEKFKERYIFCTEIAESLGVSPRKALSLPLFFEYQVQPLKPPISVG